MIGTNEAFQEGKLIMIKKMICFTAGAALLIIGLAISQEARGNKPTADRHRDRGITCSVCHGGEDAPKTAGSPKSCLLCKNHESLNVVADRTSDKNGYIFNPHHNHITETNSLECIQCHQAHKNDTFVCLDCHTTMKFK